jgi:hypothetical protein
MAGFGGHSLNFVVVSLDELLDDLDFEIILGPATFRHDNGKGRLQASGAFSIEIPLKPPVSLLLDGDMVRSRLLGRGFWLFPHAQLLSLLPSYPPLLLPLFLPVAGLQGKDGDSDEQVSLCTRCGGDAVRVPRVCCCGNQQGEEWCRVVCGGVSVARLRAEVRAPPGPSLHRHCHCLGMVRALV